MDIWAPKILGTDFRGCTYIDENEDLVHLGLWTTMDLGLL